jgi:uncharacterized membrane protein YdjX (TVP38/TMEM64 family)
MSEAETLLNEPARAAASKSKSALWRLLPIGIILAGLALSYAFGLQHYLSLSFLGESRAAMKAYAGAHYLLSAALFMAIYIAAVAFSLPAATILTVFGGFLFGWLAGCLIVVIAATIGACILFLAARSAFGGFLRDKVGGRAAALAEGFKKDAFSYLLVLRLAPVFPFFFVNIAPALFDVTLRTFAAATFLGIIPGTLAYAFLGQGVDSVLDAAQAAGKAASVSDLVTPQITLAFAALACVAAVPVIIRKLRSVHDGGTK